MGLYIQSVYTHGWLCDDQSNLTIYTLYIICQMAVHIAGVT